MATSTASASDLRASIYPRHDIDAPDGGASAVSWGAIIAGAAGAAALSLVLVLLGTGLGLSAISPWSHAGIAATTASVSTIVWITITQLLASLMGGYLAGRLRSKWAGVHTDEVYFRDTAHGFLSWAVASLLTATFLATAVGTIVAGGVRTGAAAVGGVAATAGSSAADAIAGAAGAKPSGDAPMGYFVDSLFRPSPGQPAGDAASTDTHGNQSLEVGRIFTNSLTTGALTTEDTQYLGQLVAQHTGQSQADAQKRVADTFNRLQRTLQQAEIAAKQAADKARKASAYMALWLVVSLLVGAFFAGWAATLGGRLRDSSLTTHR